MTAEADTCTPDRPPAALLPRSFRVARRREEIPDTVTLWLEPADGGAPIAYQPGQFLMLYVFGIGEVPISSITGDPEAHEVACTIRAVGAVSRALTALQEGEVLGVRGPFGTPWPLAEAAGRDVLVLAGGIGLAPLRGLVTRLIADRDRYGRVHLLYGARDPGSLLFPEERERWSASIGVEVTVDHADPGWRGAIGVVPELIGRCEVASGDAVAFVCGPEIMMRFTAQELLVRGFAAQRVWISMERNMQCAVGTCGHCQLAGSFVCRDGPVYQWPRIGHLLSVREL